LRNKDQEDALLLRLTYFNIHPLHVSNILIDLFPLWSC